MTRRLVLLGAVGILLVAGLLPLLVMLAQSVVVDGRFSLVLYRQLLSSGRGVTLVAHSLSLSLLTTALAMAAGLPLGLLFSRTDLPLRRLGPLLFTLPLLVPPYVTAVSWFDLLGRQGLLARLLGPAAAAVTSDLLFGLPGCALVLTTTFLPVVMLLTMAYLGSVNPRLEEAGRLVSGWPRVLARITVPLTAPGLTLAAMLVFLLTLGEFGVPAFLRYGVFPLESFTQFSAFYDFGAATAAAVPLAVATLVVLAAERLSRRRWTGPLQPTPGARSVARLELGRWRGWVLAAVGLAGLLLVGAPLLALAAQSASTAAYVEALTRAGASLGRSLIYAAVGASLLTPLGFLLGYLIHTRALALWRGVDALTLFLFALPSTVIGIGLIGLWNRPWTNVVYGTPAIILLGYLARYSALTSRIALSTLSQIPAAMEEAAQVVGAGWGRRLLRVVAPLARRGLAVGWLVAYLFCLRDTGVAMMVYPPGRETLPVRIFTLMANGSDQLIAALCVLLTAATLLPLGALGLVLRRQRDCSWR